MTTDMVSAISGTEFTELRATERPRGVDGMRFADWLGHEIAAVNDQIRIADQQVRQLAAGEQDNLHQVMLSLEKAKLSFELVVQVRNKLLEGYQEIMRMQV